MSRWCKIYKPSLRTVSAFDRATSYLLKLVIFSYKLTINRTLLRLQLLQSTPQHLYLLIFLHLTIKITHITIMVLLSHIPFWSLVWCFFVKTCKMTQHCLFLGISVCFYYVFYIWLLFLAKYTIFLFLLENLVF